MDDISRARLRWSPTPRLAGVLLAGLALLAVGSAAGSAPVAAPTRSSSPAAAEAAPAVTPGGAQSPAAYTGVPEWETASPSTAPADVPAAVAPSSAPISQILAEPGHVEHRGPRGEVDVNVCSYDTPPGYAHCDAHVRTDAHAATTPAAAGATTPAGTLGNGGAYDPAYLRSAYDAPSSTGGTGQTVAIAIAYDNPNAESDLGVYRSHFGLPPCTTANGCFKKVNQSGGTSSYPSPDTSWAQESALDTQMVSAICPNCKIVLVEANNSYLNNLGAAVNTAVNVFHANVVSNSYGAGEYSGETTDNANYYNHPGVAVTASSGDNGYGVEFPAASNTVTAVGGTSLEQATNTGTRNATETVWNGAGSGCSSYESKPSWQLDTGCSKRTVADVSAVADPSTPVWVYQTYGCGSSCWWFFGGTSVASPIVAAMYALANNGSTPNTLSSYPYGDSGALNDVTSGSNGSCTVNYLCTGGAGYDGPTGLGTPNGTPAFAPAPPANPTVPAAPQLSASAGDTSVALTWSVPNSGGSTITSYNVYRGTSSGGESLLASNVATPSYTDTAVTNGTGYYYEVAAVNGIGESSRSNEVSATPHPVTTPSAPQSPSASAGNGTIGVSWSAPSDNGGAPVTSYNVYRGTSPGGEGTTAYKTGLTSTTLTDSSVSVGSTYYYVVTAVNSKGEGAPSTEVSATAVTAPAKITNLVAKTSSTRGVTLTWSAPANGGSPIQGYKIYRSRSSGSETYYVTVTCTTTTCTYNDANTTSSRYYYYKVAAYNAVGTAPLSNQSVARAR